MLVFLELERDLDFGALVAVALSKCWSRPPKELFLKEKKSCLDMVTGSAKRASRKACFLDPGTREDLHMASAAAAPTFAYIHTGTDTPGK